MQTTNTGTSYAEPERDGNTLSDLIRKSETRLTLCIEDCTTDADIRELVALAMQCIQALKDFSIEERKARKQERAERIKAEQELAQYTRREQQHKRLWKTKLKPAEKATIEEFQRQLDSPNSHKDEHGYTRITFKTAAINIGMSEKSPRDNFKKVLEQCPDLVELAGLEIDPDREEYDPELKRNVPRLYIRAERSLVDAATNSTISKRVVQGGNQYHCQNPQCLSTNVAVKRRLVCLDCGHESDLDTTYPNGKLKHAKNAQDGKTNLSSPPQMDTTDGDTTPTIAIDADDSKTNLSLPPQSGYEEDSTPEKNLSTSVQPVVVGYITSDPPCSTDNLDAPQYQYNEFEEVNEIAQAAALLLAVAGESSTHIVMSAQGKKKYATIDRALTLADLVDHLQGGQARGAKLEYPDGQTRALCFDADNMQDWSRLQEFGMLLVEAGYHVILDQSGAQGRGGHLWIIFDALVFAPAARYHVCEVAPGLAQVREYWPYGLVNNQHVRLPAGKYRRYGQYVTTPVNAWCKLACISTGEVAAAGGAAAARLLLASMTSVSVVPSLPRIVDSETSTVLALPAPQVKEQDQGEEHTITVTASVELAQGVGSTAGVPAWIEEHEAPTILVERAGESQDQDVRLPEVDDVWLKRYGPIETTTCYFAVMPGYAASVYNDEHTLEEIHPREKSNGMALSPNGPERTASTGYRVTPQGERYTDHSQNGRRPDGTRDTGDCLELTSKVESKPKPALFRMTAGQIVRKATNEMEAAARAGQPLPNWLEWPVCIITPSGRRRYAELLAQVVVVPADPPQEEQTTTIPSYEPLPEIDEETEQASQRYDAARKLLEELAECGLELQCLSNGLHNLKRVAEAATPLDETTSRWKRTVKQYDSELVDILGITELPPEELPAPDSVGQGEAPHKIGACANCGSTKWFPHPELEYFCANPNCLEPIAYTRAVEARRANPFS